MSSSDLLTYRVATAVDCESLVVLVNNSYRGKSASQGWANENELVDGLRTNVDALNNIINENKSIILVFYGQTDKILKGCICLAYKPETKTAFLGMLTVRPDLQGRGYWKWILSVGETYAINEWNVDYTEMTVVVQRTELFAYYKRRGYSDTGQREPFPPGEFGHPKRDDLQFATLRKYVKMSEEKILA